MNKVMKAIGLCCAAWMILAGISMFISPKTLDFRGTVTDIETTDHEIIFHLAMPSIGATYLVAADHHTAVLPCHQDDPKIAFADIQVGDMLEGDFRKGADGRLAQFITVWVQHEQILVDQHQTGT